MEDVGVPTGARPDPEHEGWFSWGDFPRGSFAAATGRLLFKPDGPRRAIVPDVPDEAHLNMGGSIHGGAVMSFIDMSMFAGGLCAGMEPGALCDARPDHPFPRPRRSRQAARQLMSSWSSRPAATLSSRAWSGRMVKLATASAAR